MEYEEFVRKLEFYPIGTVINMTWDRGNGKLSGDYVYFEKEDEKPILRRYEETRKSLDDYAGDVAFDISNPVLSIIDISIILHKSDELIVANRTFGDDEYPDRWYILNKKP